MATIKDIAKLLELSPATVSRALHDPDSPFVSERTRQRVREAACALGYTPNASGRALATGRSHLVSLWINDPYTPYYAMVGRHLYAEASQRGFQPVIRAVTTQSDEPALLQPSDSLADGIIALDVRDPLRRCLEAFPSFPKQLVALGALCLDTVDHVRIDLMTGSTEAVQHLVDTRRGRIVALMYREQDPRTDAYKVVMREAGREPELVLIPDETRPTNRALVREYVQQKGCPSAFFCQNDDVAIATYRALLDEGYRVPDDAAIVGCDGIEDGEYLAVPLSTIVAPTQLMCMTAWQFLSDRVRSPESPLQSAVLSSHLAIRATSAV